MKKKKDYQALSKPELALEIERLLKERFSLQIQKATGQAVKTHLFKTIRSDVAYAKMLLARKEA